MLCEANYARLCTHPSKQVLILILMEYALWAPVKTPAITKLSVLILILMEYALWEKLQKLIDAGYELS